MAPPVKGLDASQTDGCLAETQLYRPRQPLTSLPSESQKARCGVVQYVALRCVYYHPFNLPSDYHPVTDTRTYEKKLDRNKPKEKWLHIWTANSSFYGRRDGDGDSAIPIYLGA